MARLQPIAEQFRIAIQETREATQKAIVETAHREHARVMRTAPQPKSFRRFVDGIEGAPIETVKADGVIYIVYERLELIAQYAMEVLFDLSPVGLPSDPRPDHPGLYRNSHTMFLKGAAVSDLSNWSPGDEIVIANFVPYSRKIELGLMKMRVPGSDFVYYQAERIVRRRFGNLAEINFTFRGIVGGGIVGGASGNKSDIRFPALVIKQKLSGRRR